MAGLVGYGAYIPYFRLKRSEIAAVLGEGGGKGTRAVASYDEDATSIGVEAARNVLRTVPDTARPQRVFFATASPPYLDKTNATVIHAALDLPASVLAVDMVGSVRSGVGAVLTAADSPVPTLAVLADIRTGLAGGADERDGGDGAVALLFGDGDSEGAPVLAEVVASAAATDEFLDRWRLPGAEASKVWEERFGEHVYGPLADAAFADALKQAGLTPGDVDHLVVSGLPSRAVRRFATTSGVRPEALADDLSAAIGNAGTAQAGIVLADVLDRATPGQTVVVMVLSDGASALVLRTTDAIAAHASAKPVAAQIAAGRDDLRYAQYLSWRGALVKEPPRRPDPTPPAAPPAHRSTRYKFGFVGSRCEACGAVHLPPVRVCMSCHAVDRMADAPMADVPATVATYTIDRLAYSPSPPVVAAVVDFDGGGRFKCQLTDVDAGALAIGDRLEPTFRKLVTAAGVHNYFWKMRPVVAATPGARGVPAGKEA
jgi:3-hydroxy-3-methylglutaryl CoA synthase